MTDEDYKKVLRILGKSGQIEHYKFSLIPDHVKDSLAVILIIGFFCFVTGFYIGVQF